MSIFLALTLPTAGILKSCGSKFCRYWKFFLKNDYDIVFSKQVAEYRKEFPSISKNEATRKEITE
jgi:hypothetical protein